MKKYIAGIVALGIAASAQAQSPGAIMDRAVKAYSDLRSVRAEFSQKITNPLTGTTASSRGVLVRKDPNLLSITFSDPKGDRIVSDGTSLWVYLPSTAPGQVIRTAASASNAMAMVDPGGVFLSSPSTRYSISGAGTAIVSGQKTNVVNLVPKKPNGTFSRAKVWIDADSDLIRQFEVVDANGLTRLVTITSLKPNASIASSEFRFTPPRNVRVLDSGGY